MLDVRLLTSDTGHQGNQERLNWGLAYHANGVFNRVESV
jgi:hypothetical protein